MGSQQTSSTDASVIITNSRYYLNETTPSTWDNDELLVLVNNGTMDIVSRTRCLESTEDISLVADTLEYSITSNYIAVTAVMYTNASSVKKGLLRKNMQSVGHVQDIGTPAWWYEWNGKIGVYPTLSSVTTEDVTVYFVSRPAAITSSDDVLVPAFYDKALTFYVVSEAFKKTGQFAKSNAFKAEYLAELDRYRTDFVNPPPEPEEAIK